MAVDLHVINFVGVKSPGRALSLISKDFLPKLRTRSNGNSFLNLFFPSIFVWFGKKLKKKGVTHYK